MKEITSDGFIGGSKKANLLWAKKGYSKKGGANSAIDAGSLKKDMIAATIAKSSSLGDMVMNARKYINDIANAARAGRPWETADTTGTNILLGRTPIEVLDGEAMGDSMAPQGYTGTALDNLTASQVNRLAKLRANNMLSRAPRRPGDTSLDDDVPDAPVESAVEDTLEKSAADAGTDMLEDVVGDFGFGRKSRQAKPARKARAKRPLRTSSKKRVSSKKGGSLSSFLKVLEDGFEIAAPEIYFPVKGIYHKLNNIN